MIWARWHIWVQRKSYNSDIFTSYLLFSCLLSVCIFLYKLYIKLTYSYIFISQYIYYIYVPLPYKFMRIFQVSRVVSRDQDRMYLTSPKGFVNYILSPVSTLIKKKVKFSSYIRKFRVEQLQSNIWLTASSYLGKYLRISSYIRKLFLIYDFATAPL